MAHQRIGKIKKKKKYKIDFGFSIKNSMELTKQIKNVTLRKGEILGSFDIVNMYPSVPVQDAIKAMRNHLKEKRAPDNIIEACVLIAETSMRQNFFQFRNKFYQQQFGLSMGSKISPYLAYIFFCELENRLKTHNLFPRIWHRYVDDVFVVIKARYVKPMTRLLNDQHQSIKFTFEEEDNNSLPFLDLLISRKDSDELKFSIYRKQTHTDRYITSDSHHSGQHQKAAFNSMVHRMLNIPMEPEDLLREKTYIYKVAELNGFEDKFVTNIINKHQKKIDLSNLTTLQPVESPVKFISIPYYPVLSDKLKNVFRKHNFQLITKSETTIKNYLGGYKDDVPKLQKSGIYAEFCRDCDSIYVGQTRRSVLDRHKEHMRAIENKDPEKSSVADHVLELGHSIDTTKLKNVKHVINSRHLNAWESLYISNTKNILMNKDPPKISSLLFKYLQIPKIY